jgi:hypothetical protein
VASSLLRRSEIFCWVFFRDRTLPSLRLFVGRTLMPWGKPQHGVFTVGGGAEFEQVTVGLLGGSDLRAGDVGTPPSPARTVRRNYRISGSAVSAWIAVRPTSPASVSRRSALQRCADQIALGWLSAASLKSRSR